MVASWLDCDDVGRNPCLEAIRQKNLADSSQAKKTQMVFVNFGNLAIMTHNIRAVVDPMALRPRLSPGVLLSVSYRAIVVQKDTIAAYK